MEYNFPMYTIGEAATATIVEFSDQDWEFNFISRPKYAHLCTIPVEGYEIFLPPNEKIGLNGPGRFVSFGKDLLDAATPFLANLIQESYNRNYE